MTEAEQWMFMLTVVYCVGVFVIFFYNCMDYSSPLDAEDKKSGARGMFLAPAWPLLLLFFIIRAILRFFKGLGGFFEAAELHNIFKDWKNK